MSNETVITIIGNLVADVELRYTQNGVAVANGTIASTPRTFDKQANEWKDGEALFLRFSVWKQAAENAAGSLTKGMRVIAQGKLKQRSYQDREGNQRTAVELEVDEIGPSLKYATAAVARAGSNGGQQATGNAWSAPQASGDAWSTPGATGAQNAAQGFDDEPVF